MNSKAFVLMIAMVGLLVVAAPTVADDWQSIACIPADPSPEEMFDVTQAVDGFEAEPLKWEALHGGQNAKAALRRDPTEHHGGATALRIDYEFTGRQELEYLQINTKLDIREPGLGLGFWAKTDGTPFHFRLRVLDRSGKTLQLDMLSANRAGWQFVAVLLSHPNLAWGGDGNRRIDYPCRLAGICIDRPHVGFSACGSLWLDDVALLRPHKPAPSRLTVEVRPKRFGNLYAVGEPVAIRVRGGEGCVIDWSFTDFWGRQLARGQDVASHTEARFTPQRAGFFNGTIELLGPGGPLEKQIFAFAALPGGGETARSDFLGMCAHFGQRSYPRGAEESDLAGEVNRTAARVAQAGASQKAWITEIGWPTHRMSTGSDEHAQACHAVRALVMLQSTGIVEKVFWYDFKDDGLNRDYNEDNFGVVHNQLYNCAPKPAAVALAVFLRLTHGAPCGPLWQEGNAYAMPYRLPDGQQRLVAWAMAPGTPVHVSGALADVRDLMGNPCGRGGPHLLGPEPIYLTGKDLHLGR